MASTATKAFTMRAMADDRVDPISLEPLAELGYPPFELRAAREQETQNDLFDGKLLASYLVSTGQFFHPISRRALDKDECAALDEYLVNHRLAEPQVQYAFDHKDEYESHGRSSQASRVLAMREEADRVLQSLFSSTSSRYPCRACNCYSCVHFRHHRRFSTWATPP
eukprot:6182754-Pleurochrysis_carterae.AAC.2